MHSIRIERGAVRGSQYTFNKDEGLPLHDHEDDTAHMVFVQKGSIEISGPSIPKKVLVAGNIYDFAPNSPHAILALEDNTIIWNPQKGGS